MKIFRNPVFLSVAAAIFLVGAFWAPVNSAEKEAVLVGTILNGLQRMHYQPVRIDDDFSEKLYTTYLDRLDGGKRFFTQKEIKDLKKFKTDLDDEANKGTYEFFDQAIALHDAARLKVQEYYRAALSEPVDFSDSESFETDGEKKEYAKNDKNLKEEWRKLMKYETLTRLTNKLEAQEKAKEKIAKGEIKEDETEESKKDREELLAKTYEELEADARKDALKIYDDWFERMSKLKRSDRLSDYLNTITNVFDPHTGYYEPIDKENFDIGMSGRLEGIGARLQESDDYTKVSSIVVGGPAWKGGELEENDLIMAVSQEDEDPVDITGMGINDVVKQIRGPKGTIVTLKVKKATDSSVKEIKITRDIVIMEEGFAKSLLLNSDKNEKIGYLKLPRFYADFDDADGRFCSTDVGIEIEKLKNENVKGIILDLRNNGGGSLRDVVKMSGFFIEKGPIVQVKSRTGKPEILSDRDPSVQYDGPLIVMVNEFSASASEILAAALQDYKRAVIVGSTSTFGKGTVQRFFNLDRAIVGNNDIKPLGSMKLTTQKFYRINGGSTQLKGVEPDIVLPDNYKYIETGEKENEYPLKWTEIEAVDYSQNVVDLSNIQDMVAASKRRVESNEVFQKIESNALRLKKQRDQSEFPLSMKEFKAWDDKIAKESEQYKDLFTEIEAMSAVNLEVDMEGFEVDESKKARNDDWLKNIKKDAYLYETLNIMHDMISNTIADGSVKEKK